eukprot:1157778-Pelagomonas_calceolata.AAC.15
MPWLSIKWKETDQFYQAPQSRLKHVISQAIVQCYPLTGSRKCSPSLVTFTKTFSKRSPGNPSTLGRLKKALAAWEAILPLQLKRTDRNALPTHVQIQALAMSSQKPLWRSLLFVQSASRSLGEPSSCKGRPRSQQEAHPPRTSVALPPAFQPPSLPPVRCQQAKSLSIEKLASNDAAP